MNDTPDIEGGANSQSVAAAELRNLIERIERLEEEKQALADDVKEVKAEAKGRGYDTKIISKIVRIRKMDKAKREEEEALTETYLHALGMI